LGLAHLLHLLLLVLTLALRRLLLPLPPLVVSVLLTMWLRGQWRLLLAAPAAEPAALVLVRLTTRRLRLRLRPSCQNCSHASLCRLRPGRVKLYVARLGGARSEGWIRARWSKRRCSSKGRGGRSWN
jgi:hypothetical protein